MYMCVYKYVYKNTFGMHSIFLFYIYIYFYIIFLFMSSYFHERFWYFFFVSTQYPFQFNLRIGTRLLLLESYIFYHVASFSGNFVSSFGLGFLEWSPHHFFFKLNSCLKDKVNNSSKISKFFHRLVLTLLCEKTSLLFRSQIYKCKNLQLSVPFCCSHMKKWL